MRIWHAVIAAAVAIGSAACTEHLSTPGECPTFCPGGQAVFRDTILDPIAQGDSSFTGFVANEALPSVLASSGGAYGEHRALFRFVSRGDSVLVSDTNRAFTLDSVSIEIGIQDRDTTQAGFVVEIYRLPLTLDSSSTFAQVDAAMTSASEIAEIPLPVATRAGLFHVTFSGDSLARVGFVASDSEVLQIGLRVRASGPTAARIGAPPSGTFAPSVTSYVEAIGVADSLKPQTLGLIADQFATMTPPAPAPSRDLLAVGGFPVSRAFIRFNIPAYLRDSATIIRATLDLHANAALVGIPADTATLYASALLVDFGAKSPIVGGATDSTYLVPGDIGASLEVASIVQSWQGKSGTPPVIRLNLAQEGATYLFPLFLSTRSGGNHPTLRITYRPPFAFQGY